MITAIVVALVAIVAVLLVLAGASVRVLREYERRDESARRWARRARTRSRSRTSSG